MKMHSNSMFSIVGYITSDSLTRGFIPHAFQNFQIRSFVQNSGHNYLLSWTEQKKMSPFILNSLLEEDFYDGICFYSLEQLFLFPKSLNLIMNLSQKKIWVGFALEKLSVEGEQGLQGLIQLYKLKKLIEGPRQDLERLWGN